MNWHQWLFIRGVFYLVQPIAAVEFLIKTAFRLAQVYGQTALGIFLDSAEKKPPPVPFRRF